MKLYKCTDCQKKLDGTLDNFFKCQLDRGNKNTALTVIGKCKVCSQKYHENYRESLRQKRLTRKNQPAKYREHGILYIIGTTPDNPIKIGITSGTTTEKRLMNLQTSHWLDLKILYESLPRMNVRKKEIELDRKSTRLNSSH